MNPCTCLGIPISFNFTLTRTKLKLARRNTCTHRACVTHTYTHTHTHTHTQTHTHQYGSLAHVYVYVHILRVPLRKAIYKMKYGTVSAKIAPRLKCYKNASRLNRYNFPTDNAIDFLFSTLIVKWCSMKC